MTVRAWFTISALVLIALVAAVAYQFLRPITPPEILVTAGETRLEPAATASCWPQRDGETRCSRDTESDAAAAEVRGEGSFRVVVAYPAQPDDGTIRIATSRGETVLRREWTRSVRYDLEPGDYVLEARAAYPEGAFVAHTFRFSVAS